MMNSQRQKTSLPSKSINAVLYVHLRNSTCLAQCANDYIQYHDDGTDDEFHYLCKIDFIQSDDVDRVFVMIVMAESSAH